MMAGRGFTKLICKEEEGSQLGTQRTTSWDTSELAQNTGSADK